MKFFFLALDDKKKLPQRTVCTVATGQPAAICIKKYAYIIAVDKEFIYTFLSKRFEAQTTLNFLRLCIPDYFF